MDPRANTLPVKLPQRRCFAAGIRAVEAHHESSRSSLVTCQALEGRPRLAVTGHTILHRMTRGRRSGVRKGHRGYLSVTRRTIHLAESDMRPVREIHVTGIAIHLDERDLLPTHDVARQLVFFRMIAQWLLVTASAYRDAGKSRVRSCPGVLVTRHTRHLFLDNVERVVERNRLFDGRLFVAP